ALKSALATRDGSALERAAHQLRGALMTMAAPGAAAAALRLEEIGREQDFRSAAEAWACLTNELDRLEPRLAALGARAKEETTSCSRSSTTSSTSPPSTPAGWRCSVSPSSYARAWRRRSVRWSRGRETSASRSPPRSPLPCPMRWWATRDACAG